jgi:hypothetical protein
VATAESILGKAKALRADAMIVFEGGYAGSVSFGNAYTNANVYPGGFNANTGGTSVFEGADESRVHGDQVALEPWSEEGKVAARPIAIS